MMIMENNRKQGNGEQNIIRTSILCLLVKTVCTNKELTSVQVPGCVGSAEMFVTPFFFFTFDLCRSDCLLQFGPVFFFF